MSFTFATNITDIIKGFSLIALLVLAVIYLPKFMDKMDNIGKSMDATTIEQITSNMVKVHLAESNKDLKKLLNELKKENNEAIIAALSGQDARIKEIADIVAIMNSSTDPDPTVDVAYGEEEDPRRLETFVVYRTDADGSKYPTGIVYYSPNVKEGPKFSYQQYPLDIHATIVSSEEGEEEKRHATIWVESNFVKSSKGKQFTLDLRPENIRWAKAKPNEKSWAWNPRVSLDATFTNSVWYPGLGVSLFSYGRTDIDMDWRFLGISLGGDSNNIYGGFTLFEYNFGKFLPVVENVFAGPNITYGISVEDDTQDNVSYGLNFSVPF